MMKRLIVVGAACLVLIHPVSAQSVDPSVRVGLIPIRSTSPQIPVAATSAIDDTLRVTLQFLPGFIAIPLTESDILDVTTSSTPEADGNLTRIAVERSLDHIVYGTASLNTDGAISVALQVFDPKSRRVAHREQAIAESVMDLFDLSDRLIVRLVENFANVRVEYGRLAIVLPNQAGASATYPEIPISVDGIAVSDDLRSTTIERMVAGNHTVSIESTNRSIAWEQLIIVRPGETTRVYPLLPGVEETTRGRVDRIVDRIVQVSTIRRGDRTIDDEFERAREVIGTVPGYYGDELRQKFASMETALSAPTETEITREPADAALVRAVLNLIVPYPDSDFPAFDTYVSRYADNVPPFGTITVDGDERDWSGIPALAVDPAGDVDPDSDLADITAVHLAMDEEFLYLWYAVPDGRIPRSVGVRYELIIRKLYPGQRAFLRIESENESVFRAQTAVFDGKDSYTTRTEDNAVAIGPAGIEARFALRHIHDLLSTRRNDPTGPNGLDKLTFESFSGYADDPYYSLPLDKLMEKVDFTPVAYYLY